MIGQFGTPESIVGPDESYQEHGLNTVWSGFGRRSEDKHKHFPFSCIAVFLFVLQTLTKPMW